MNRDDVRFQRICCKNIGKGCTYVRGRIGGGLSDNQMETLVSDVLLIVLLQCFEGEFDTQSQKPKPSNRLKFFVFFIVLFISIVAAVP